MAALVSPRDLARLDLLDAQRKEAAKVFDDIHRRNRNFDPDEVERDVAEALAEVRSEERERKRREQAP